MQSLKILRVTRAMAIRIAADVVMINFALISALAVRLGIHIAFRAPDRAIDNGTEIWSYVTAFAHNNAVLSLICLAAFALSGFYTYGRHYQGRYKAAVISQAVVQGYLVFFFLSYFLWDELGLTQVPRGALIVAFAFNMGLTLASRCWTFLWEKVIRPEREVRINDRDAAPKSVLVIGGAGYIGSALLPKLLKKGYKVRVLDMFLYGPEPIENVANHPNLELIHGDFRHVDKVVRVMRDMDAVIHLGAIVGDPACDLDPKVTVDVNLSATKMIAQVAKASGIRRFIFASTCSVYGACDEVLDERSEVKPISLYGNTKLAAERGLEGMADASFVPTIVRFATIYGLSGRTRFDLVVNLLTAMAKVTGEIKVFGGKQWRPFVHVDDAALALFTIIESPLPLVANETFNVGSDDQNYTIEEIGRMIKEQIFTAELILDEGSIDNRNYRVNFQKIRNILNFEPQWSVDDGIRQVAEAVASGEVTDYRDSKYSNVKFLSETGAIEIIRVDDDWSRELIQPPVASEIST